MKKQKPTRSWIRIQKLAKRIAALEQENQRLREEVERADAALSIDNCRSAG